MRVLIIEDELKTGAYLKKGLTENGFVVDTAADGQDGLFNATTYDYDLVILDVTLPKIDGWSIVTAVRRAGKLMPILMLTARDSLQDKVKGLELGADDYLVKPFAFSELLARVRTLLRRGQVMSQPDVIQVADLEIHLLLHKVIRDKQKINLTPKEFNLLTLLAKHKGELLSRTIIAEQVWDMNFDSDTNIVDVLVRRLRQKIDNGFEKKLIHTLRGIGYVMEER